MVDFINDVQNKVQALANKWSIRDLCQGQSKYPILAVEPIQIDPRLPSILISGGIHGDEPAGVHAIVSRLENDFFWNLRDKVNFILLPCVNPEGYQNVTRRTPADEDLNRGFKGDSMMICGKVKEYLLSKHLFFPYALDLHETLPTDDCDATQGEVPPSEFYLYEVCFDHSRRIGRDIIKEIKTKYKTCQLAEIFSDKNSDGLIAYPEASSNPTYAEATSFDFFLINHNLTASALTIETITTDPMAVRDDQHGIAIQCVLRRMGISANP